MRIESVSMLFALVLTCLFVLPTMADADAETDTEKDDGLTEVVASQNLSVRRGEDAFVVERLIHPKNLERNKHMLDRFALIRFDSKDFGKKVGAAGFRIQPRSFGNHKDKPYRFRVYGVLDGDPQDEKFTEKSYDPNAEGSLADRRTTSMVERRQVAMLGTFSTKEDEAVLFTNRNFLAFVRGDTNGTVTLLLVRQTVVGNNSSFYDRRSETPPTLVFKLRDKGDDAAEEPAEEDAQGDTEEQAEAKAEAATE